MKNWRLILILIAAISACKTMGFDDKHYDLYPSRAILVDPNNQTSPVTDCEPKVNTDGTVTYKCVVHFFDEYKRMKDYIVTLEDELKQCQSQGN